MRPRRWFVTSVRSAAGAIQVFGFTTRRGHLELSRFGSKRRDTWFLFLSILSCRNPSPIRLQSHDPAVRPPSPAAFTRPPRPRRRPPSPLLLGCSAAGPAGGSDRRVASPSPPAAAPLRDRPYRCLARVATTHRLFLSPAVVGRRGRAGRIPPPDQDVLHARRDSRRHESSPPASPLLRLTSPRLLSSVSSPQLSATPESRPWRDRRRCESASPASPQLRLGSQRLPSRRPRLLPSPVPRPPPVVDCSAPTSISFVHLEVIKTHSLSLFP